MTESEKIMALFIQKPVFWNKCHYLAPSGVIGTGGFPKQTGFGHEEWNNSPKMLITQGKQKYRVFHTEGLGTAPLDENAGQTFIFMTASHDGIQQLVGIAGNAIGLSGDHYRPQREKIARELSLHTLWKDAWNIPNVRKQHNYDQIAFLRDWEKDLHWIPNWMCPDEFFLWFDEPVTLDAKSLTGKNRLLGMFSSYTELDLTTVSSILEAIPTIQRKEKLASIIDAIKSSPTEPLSTTSNLYSDEPITTTLAKIHARRGQGKFREDLIQIWGGACSVTGLECREVLRASHIKPWANSTPKQRLDSYNGLLLSANLDALFDKGLITFESTGQMKISKKLNAKHRDSLGLPKPLRFVPKELSNYLSYHRENIFQK